MGRWSAGRRFAQASGERRSTTASVVWRARWVTAAQ